MVGTDAEERDISLEAMEALMIATGVCAVLSFGMQWSSCARRQGVVSAVARYFSLPFERKSSNDSIVLN